MAGSLNKVMLIGRLTRDPELRYLPSGQAVCQLGIATNRFGKDQAGERKEFTEFHDVSVWNQGQRKLAELCAQYLAKGRVVYVEGRLQTRSWDDKETGAKRSKTDVVADDVQFLDSRQDGGAGGGGGGGYSGAGAGSGFGGGSAPQPAGVGSDAGGDIDPDDIPF